MNTVRGDFHHPPLPDASFNVLVAAFCLYHSTRPADVVAEIAHCLAPGGRAILVTKSVDSYQEATNPRHLAAELRRRTRDRPLTATYISASGQP
ncbi:class I SAM-dependent methyltransferase [Nocardia sp. NPDC058705]|uniref:class I SAM-dependent methyltransferase n=1 Tax=Nocardia sp. NPDC058705 TaxID=3346609 RepID=UPI0036B4F32D